MRITFSPTFLRKLKKMPPALQEEVFEKVDNFKSVENHKKLKLHKLHEKNDLYSFSINYKIRVIFEYKNSIHVNFLTLGSHDDVY